MTVFDVSLYEPIHPGVTADSTAVTADSTFWTADGGPLVGATDSNDAVVNASFISADLYEPIHSGWTADSGIVTADSTFYTADGGPLIGATDFTDAEVISIPVVGEGGGVLRPPRPFPVVGVGYGILPRLEGEAFGVVGVIGDALGELPRIRGAADGAVGVAGRSAGQLIVGGAALGVRGQVGAGEAILKTFEATATGRHDDDEAAVIAILLAA